MQTASNTRDAIRARYKRRMASLIKAGRTEKGARRFIARARGKQTIGFEGVGAYAQELSRKASASHGR